MGTFAKTVGTTTATISRVADGTVVPRRDLMHRIYGATNGSVTPNDLVGIYCVHPCMALARDGASGSIEEQENKKRADE